MCIPQGFDKFGVGKMETIDIQKELFEEVGAEVQK